jgi:xylulokinase
MAVRSCLLGIDLGTSSVKAVVIDERGNLLARGSAEYPIHTPHAGWAEQDTRDWWNATLSAVRQAVQGLEGRIAALGLSGQMHGTVLLDENDTAPDPAVIWADQRSAGEVLEFSRVVGEDLLARVAGTAPAAGFMGPTLLWMKRNQPRRLERARSVLLPKDYLRLRMTGVTATEASDASSTALFDVKRRSWSSLIIKKLGLPESLFPRVLESAQVAGKLRKEQAGELGLPAGLPVVAGCADQAAQAVGNGLLEPGRGSVTIGSGGQIFQSLRAPVVNRELNLHVFCHAPENRWYVMGAMLTAGLSFRWFRDLIGLTARPDAYDYLSQAASEISPGAEGLLFLPYLAGERSPHMDPGARGAFVGCTMRHGMAHMARAIMEGVAFALRQVMDAMAVLEVPFKELMAAGNGLESPVWRQIVSDVLGKPLTLSREREQTGRGAAMIAGIGAGVYSGYDELVSILPRNTESTEPILSNCRVYEEQYRRFSELYPLLKPMFHELSSDQ